jgi:hypothetical protein
MSDPVRRDDDISCLSLSRSVTTYLVWCYGNLEGITTVGELLDVAQNGELTKLFGIGATRAAQISDALEQAGFKVQDSGS